VHIQNILTPHILAELTIASKTAAIQYLYRTPDFRNYHIWLVLATRWMRSLISFVMWGITVPPYGRRDALYLARLVN